MRESEPTNNMTNQSALQGLVYDPDPPAAALASKNILRNSLGGRVSGREGSPPTENRRSLIDCEEGEFF